MLSCWQRWGQVGWVAVVPNTLTSVTVLQSQGGMTGQWVLLEKKESCVHLGGRTEVLMSFLAAAASRTAQAAAADDRGLHHLCGAVHVHLCACMCAAVPCVRTQQVCTRTCSVLTDCRTPVDCSTCMACMSITTCMLLLWCLLHVFVCVSLCVGCSCSFSSDSALLS